MPKAASKSGQGTSRLRAYTACENCRLRKIRCSGQMPCQACIAGEIEHTCLVKQTPKPKRWQTSGSPQINQMTCREGAEVDQGGPSASPSTHHQRVPEGSGSASSWSTQPLSAGLEVDFPSAAFDPNQPTASTGYNRSSFHLPHAPSRNPLEEIDMALGSWCSSKGIPLRPLLFQDKGSLSDGYCSPLPSGQALIDFEDDLMRSLVSAEDLDSLEMLDSSRLLNLYTRYRALPGSLTDDQTALIYASLCVARHTQLRGSVAGRMVDPYTTAREDVTYYRMARASLRSWGRASITSMRALFCMTIYAQLHGGASEHGEVLAIWADQIKSLGLNQRSTAQLYPPEDLTDKLLGMYSYAETLRAIMTDLIPAIPIVELEVQYIPNATGIMGFLTRASNSGVNFLRDHADPSTDMSTAGYIGMMEEAWSAQLDMIRAEKESGLAKVRLGWAEMRIHWLRILLHSPRLTSTSGRANQAAMYISRALSHIINIHTEAAAVDKLDPSWIQLKRIIVCGELLILCCVKGEIHPFEGADLFGKLLMLLQAHVHFWPSVVQTIQAYRDAASHLGLSVPSDMGAAQTYISDWNRNTAEPVMPADSDTTLFLDLELDTFVRNLWSDIE